LTDGTLTLVKKKNSARSEKQIITAKKKHKRAQQNLGVA